MKNRVYDLGNKEDVQEWDKDIEMMVERANNVEGFTLVTGGTRLVAFRTTHKQTITFDGELLDEQQQIALKERWDALREADLVSCQVESGSDIAFSVTLEAGEVIRFDDYKDIIPAEELFEYVLDAELVYEPLDGDNSEEHA